MFLTRWTRRGRAKRAEEQRKLDEIDAQRRETEEHLRRIRSWGNEIITVSMKSGYAYDQIMAVGPPPDGAQQYYAGTHYDGLGRTPYGIYVNVSEWPRMRDELLAKYESGDLFKKLEVLEKLGGGISFHANV